MKELNVHWAQRLALLYLGAMLMATWGYHVGKNKWWPASVINELNEFAEGHPEEAKTSVIEKLTNDFGGAPHRKLVTYSAKQSHPDRVYSEIPLVNKNSRRQDPLIHITPTATPALRLIYGSFDHQKSINGALLISPEGKVLWEWIVHEDDVKWQQEAHAERKFPHGLIVNQDGSLIFSFDNGVSLQKFDRCSQQVWATQARVDHSLNFDPEGRLWGVISPDHLGVFDPKTGAKIREINMKDWVRKNNKLDPLGMRQIDYHNSSRWMRRGGGYWHPNDAEPLPAKYAAAFPQFKPGDLLMSYRSLNLIFVADPKDGRIKWWRVGAWRRQHDPDWQPDGTITVFNNNMHLRTSSIVKIDPKTYQHQVIFDGKKENFYTWMRGKHQILENGHLTITSPQQGRVFEVDTQGEVVFEFVNRYDADRTLLVSELVTLPLDYFGDNLNIKCAVTTTPASKE